MNPDDTRRDKANKDYSPPNRRLSASDTNANLNLTTDESKGAIPKVKPLIQLKTSLRKTNNNVEEFSQDVVRKNGFSLGKSVASINYFNSSEAAGACNEDVTSPEKEKCPRTTFNIPIESDCFNPECVSKNNSSCSLNLVSVANFQDLIDIKDGDSSSDDNELLSVSDDGCIYTYKGDHIADLPSSFFNLEIPIIDDAQGDNNREEHNSSPEMDFLEMDFDPGPSGDADSDSVSNMDQENTAALPLDPEQPDLPIDNSQPCCSKDLNQEPVQPNIPPVKPKFLNTAIAAPKTAPLFSYLEPIKAPIVAEIKMPWSCSLSERTRTAKSLRMIKRHHNSKGELTSPNSETFINDSDLNNLTAFHNFTGKCHVEEKTTIMGDIEKVMIWTNQEACLKQITQVGPSACGATAVLNVLNALRFPIPTLERVQECMKTRLRANSSPLTEYLLSRSIAGCSHRDIIEGLYKLSDKKIYSRFFHMYPERVVNLQSWLAYWIKNGAIPIATINLQKSYGNIPDSWHHQMIFGVGPDGIYLTNPLECVDASQLWPQLSSESVLLIKTEDVISRWNPKVDLLELMRIKDVRWKELNVVGQVAKVVRENRRDHRFTSHIKIPAEYKAGITMAIEMGAPGFNLLRQCPELPLVYPEQAASAL